MFINIDNDRILFDMKLSDLNFNLSDICYFINKKIKLFLKFLFIFY